MTPIISAQIDQFVKMEEILREVDSLMKNLDNFHNIIFQTNDKILVRFKEFIKAQVNQVDSFVELVSVLQMLTSSDGIARDLANFIEQFWDARQMNIQLFLNESNIHQKSLDTIDDQLFRQWLEEAADYKILDPVYSSEIRNVLQHQLVQIESHIISLSQTECQNIQAFNSEKKRFENEMNFKIPSIIKNKQNVENKINHLKIDINKLFQDVKDEKLKYLTDACEWYANVTSFKFNDSQELQNEWVKRRDIVLDKFSCEKLKQNPDLYLKIQENIYLVKQNRRDK